MARSRHDRQAAERHRDRDRHPRQTSSTPGAISPTPSQGVMQRPNWQCCRRDAQGGDAKPQPFALAERLADNTIARSKSAEALLKAIDALRTKLTPEQLDKVSAIEARFTAHHHGPHFDGPAPTTRSRTTRSPTAGRRMGQIRGIASNREIPPRPLIVPYLRGRPEQSAAPFFSCSRNLKGRLRVFGHKLGRDEDDRAIDGSGAGSEQLGLLRRGEILHRREVGVVIDLHQPQRRIARIAGQAWPARYASARSQARI